MIITGHKAVEESLETVDDNYGVDRGVETGKWEDCSKEVESRHIDDFVQRCLEHPMRHSENPIWWFGGPTIGGMC